jgi:hypothetical protein
MSSEKTLKGKRKKKEKQMFWPSRKSRCLHATGFGTADGLRKTTRWVMQRGILEQFRGTRVMLYDPPTSVSPTHN